LTRKTTILLNFYNGNEPKEIQERSQIANPSMNQLRKKVAS